MAIVNSINARRLTGIGVLMAILAAILLASPTSAGGKTYSVDISEDVASAFSAMGNNQGNRIHEHGKTATLDLDGISVIDHENFACPPDPASVGGDQQLDDEAWNFSSLRTSNGHLSSRFRLLVECDDGFDQYVLIIRLFDSEEGSGPGSYDSDDARIVIQHYAEKDDPDNPGRKRTSHTSHCCFDPFFSEAGHSITVDIADIT